MIWQSHNDIQSQCWLNFEELLEGDNALPLSNDQKGAVDHIMLTEREAVLCHTMDQAARKGLQPNLSVLKCLTIHLHKRRGVQSSASIIESVQDGSWSLPLNSLPPFAATTSTSYPSLNFSFGWLENYIILCDIILIGNALFAGSKAVVGVFGAAHLTGVVELWETKRWQSICTDLGVDNDSNSEASAATDYQDSQHFTEDDLLDEATSGKDQVERLKRKVADRLKKEEEIGVKRALLESVMRLKTTSGENLPRLPCGA